MRMIRYEEYVKDVVNHLDSYQTIYWYEWKFEFTKNGADRKILVGILFYIFNRYMDNEIKIK